MSEIYVSTGAFRARALGEILDCCRQYGIERLELSSGVTCSAGVLEQVWHGRERGMRYLVHHYFPPPRDPFVLNLATGDLALLERGRQHCRGSIDLCAELGSPFYSVHAGLSIDPHPEDLGRPQTHLPRGDVAAAHVRFIESVRLLAAYATARGVRLLVENHVVAPFNLVGGENRFLLGVTAEDLLRILREVDHPGVGLLVDLGHLKVSANTLGFDPHAFLDAVAPHLDAFHLSDNDGTADTNQVFDAAAWFLDRLLGFPSAILVLEAYRLAPEQIATALDVLQGRLAARC